MADKYRIARESNENGFDFAIRSYRHYYLQGKWQISSWKTQEPDWWPEDHYLRMSFEVEQDNKMFQDRLDKVLQEMRI